MITLKNRFGWGFAAFVGLLLAGGHSASAGVIFSDGEFGTWTSHAFQISGSNSTQTFFASSSGGNPNGMFTAYSTRADGGQVMSAHIKEDAYTLSPLSGSFTLTFDYKRAAEASTGFYGTGMVIRQGSKYWAAVDSAVNDKTEWTTSASTNSSLSGSLTSYTALYGTTGAPVLTGGVPTYFGFLTYLNGPASGIWGSSFDNLVLSTPNNAIVVAPEPASLGLVAAGLGFAIRRRPRRASR